MSSSSSDDEQFSMMNRYNDYVEPREQEVQSHTGILSYDDFQIRLAQDLSGGCGGKTWQVADVMIDYIVWKNKQLNGEMFKNQKVVEIGSGTGLVGLAVAKACPLVDKIYLTDITAMMSLMQENIKLNDLEDKITAEVYKWGEETEESSKLTKADVILASDCIYLEAAFKPLLDALIYLSNKETVIYVTYQKRRKADKRFFQMARKVFDIVEIQDDPKKLEYSRKGQHFYIFKRKI